MLLPPGAELRLYVDKHTLQKSMDLTPLLPRAGPTGGLGDAWPAPTMSLTIWSTPPAPRPFDIFEAGVVVDEAQSLCWIGLRREAVD